MNLCGVLPFLNVFGGINLWKIEDVIWPLIPNKLQGMLFEGVFFVCGRLIFFPLMILLKKWDSICLRLNYVVIQFLSRDG